MDERAAAERGRDAAATAQQQRRRESQRRLAKVSALRARLAQLDEQIADAQRPAPWWIAMGRERRVEEKQRERKEVVQQLAAACARSPAMGSGGLRVAALNACGLTDRKSVV